MYSPFSLLTNATDIFNLFDTKLDIVTFPILALCNKHLCDTMPYHTSYFLYFGQILKKTKYLRFFPILILTFSPLSHIGRSIGSLIPLSMDVSWVSDTSWQNFWPACWIESNLSVFYRHSYQHFFFAKFMSTLQGCWFQNLRRALFHI